ncbi:MAG: DUF4389 domain-containing protein [Methanomicrobiales archaeon]|nr:DUF4389 domain-containing protein [Methanomicrobiales archaeon]
MDSTGEPLKELFSYEEKAGRLELLVRIVYSILVGIVAAVYGIVAGLCTIVQFFVILILGRRSRGLSDFIRGYLEYHVHILSYTSLMTDARPGVFPKPVHIYEKDMPPAP